MGMATLYSLWVVGVRIVSGPAPFQEVGASLPAVIGAYYFGGLIGGLLFDGLRPLSRFYLGAVAIGVLVASLVFMGITMASEGVPTTWTAQDWQDCLVLGTIFGVILSSVIWFHSKR